MISSFFTDKKSNLFLCIGSVRLNKLNGENAKIRANKHRTAI